MSLDRVSVPGMVIAILLLLSPASLPAQAPDCTYDRCALRLQYRTFSTRIVQGATADRVGTLGLFPPPIAPLESSSDSAVTRLYRGYRTSGQRSGAFALVGLASTVASFIFFSQTDLFDPDTGDQGAWIALSIVGIGASIGAGVNRARSMDQLQEAMWRHNGHLPR